MSAKKLLVFSVNRKDLLILVFNKFDSVCVNSSARPQKTVGGKWEQIGNKTECALLELAFKLGYDYENYHGKENVTIFSLNFIPK